MRSFSSYKRNVGRSVCCQERSWGQVRREGCWNNPCEQSEKGKLLGDKTHAFTEQVITPFRQMRKQAQRG